MVLNSAIDKYIMLKDKILSPSTIAGYKNIQKNHLKRIMNKSLNKITCLEIQQEINDFPLASVPRPCATYTAY